MYLHKLDKEYYKILNTHGNNNNVNSTKTSLILAGYFIAKILTHSLHV